MDLRVTLQSMLQEALARMREQTDRLGVLQQQVTTGQRILAPSDDPQAALSALAARAQDGRLDSYLNNIKNARSVLEVSNSSLTDAGTLLTQARQIAIEGSNSANEPGAMETLAQEVDGIIARMLEIARTQHDDRYVFSGSASATDPFVVTAADSQGHPTAIAYQGADERATVSVGQRLGVPTLYTGAEVFQQRDRQATIYTGQTGATPGSGTDSAVGRGTLLVQHTATTYSAGSGVQAGASSAAGDSILGPSGAHTLTIVDTSGTGASGTVSLDGGPAVAFTNADTDLKVPGVGQDVVFVNMSAITASFSGTVNITADGTLSVDGGAASVPINFSANQVVTNSVTGAVTNVNSTGIRHIGKEQLEYPGTNDVFQALMTLRDDLRNAQGVNQARQLEMISNDLSDLDRVRTGVLDRVGEQAVSLQYLDGLEKRTQDVQLELKKLTADLDGVDLAQAVVDLQSQQNLLQLTLASTAKIFDQNLLDFIR